MKTSFKPYINKLNSDKAKELCKQLALYLRDFVDEEDIIKVQRFASYQDMLFIKASDNYVFPETRQYIVEGTPVKAINCSIPNFDFTHWNAGFAILIESNEDAWYCEFQISDRRKIHSMMDAILVAEEVDLSQESSFMNTNWIKEKDDKYRQTLNSQFNIVMH